jgi:hypothetical protein
LEKNEPATKSAPAAGTVVLKHKLKAGETLRTRTTHVANTLTRVQGTEDISEANTVSEKVWDVKSVEPNGNITFEYRLEALNISQKQSDRPEVTYNSKTDEKPPEIFARLAETLAKPIATITIDGSRETRVKLENGTYKTIKLREQYTLEKVSAGVATIRVDTHPLTPSNDANVDSQLMQQLSKGIIKFDIDNGRLISKQLDWEDEVVGFRGAESSLKYSARFTEEPL